MEELFFRKLKFGFECYDRNGHKAQGLTKEMAKHNFYMRYKFETPNANIDMSKYKNNMGG